MAKLVESWSLRRTLVDGEHIEDDAPLGKIRGRVLKEIVQEDLYMSLETQNGYRPPHEAD